MSHHTVHRSCTVHSHTHPSPSHNTFLGIRRHTCIYMCQQQRFPTMSSPRTPAHRSTAIHYACSIWQEQVEHKFRRMIPCLLPSIDRHRRSLATPTAARTCPATDLAPCRCLAIVALPQTSLFHFHQMQDQQIVREWSAAEQQQNRK